MVGVGGHIMKWTHIIVMVDTIESVTIMDADTTADAIFSSVTRTRWTQ